MSEENILKQKHDDRYNAYVKEVTPTYNWFVKCIQAFIVGGIICTIGQCINWAILHLDITKEEAALWTTLALIFLSIVLTGLNIYPQIAKWGGAGSLVPITGFANSVVAPAIEFKKDERDIIRPSQKKPDFQVSMMIQSKYIKRKEKRYLSTDRSNATS